MLLKRGRTSFCNRTRDGARRGLGSQWWWGNGVVNHGGLAVVSVVCVGRVIRNNIINVKNIYTQHLLYSKRSPYASINKKSVVICRR